MGVDPGTQVTGYGLLHLTPQGLKVLGHGAIELGQAVRQDRESESHPLKLSRLFHELQALIDTHHPDELAIEAPFFGKNVQAMLKLGRAQGVAMAAAMSRDIPVSEYAPSKVKKALTGNGNASKEQLAAMLPHLMPSLAGTHFATADVSDALAIAYCHYMQQVPGGAAPARRYGSWAGFIAANPERKGRG